MTTPTFALVADLETTTSDPHEQIAAILEVGAILCRWEPDLPEVARASLLIRPPGAQPDHDYIWTRMLPVVRDMHTANGLWREATSSDQAWDAPAADRALRDWLVGYAGDGPVAMLGSGTGHLDQPYVKRHLPQLASRLTYWTFDIGVIRRGFELAGRGDLVNLARDVDAKPHRGLGDAELHLAEARRDLRLLATIGGHTLADDPAAVQAFRDAWEAADARGEDGSRVVAGLRAAAAAHAESRIDPPAATMNG